MKNNNYRHATEHTKIYRPWGSYLSLAEGEGWKVKRINVHSSIYMNTNIDKISVKTSKISDYKGSHQYVTHANGINKRLFAEKLYKLTGVEFDVIHDFKLKSFNSTDASLVDDDNVNYGLNIYAVCSAA